MAWVDFKFCQKCGHCRTYYRKEHSDCFIKYRECEMALKIDNLEWRHLYVFPNMVNLHIEAPEGCPFYAEMCLQTWKKEQRKCPTTKS